MPSRGQKNKLIGIGGVIAAVLLGGAVGLLVYNPFEPPPPPPPKIDLNMPYDDAWGRLTSPDAEAVVTHILVSWTGANPRAKPKQPRTKEEARKLIDQIWAMYRHTPTPENWKSLQEQYNEDNEGGPQSAFNKYTCKANDGLDPKFSATGKSTRSKHARITESAFGFHLIRRE
ncbi:MAG: peptidylprolyl isomerase [Planctomycetes bacterium]|nr:peptidylprolyl isomerase [Planctomycetota bacterium]